MINTAIIIIVRTQQSIEASAFLNISIFDDGGIDHWLRQPATDNRQQHNHLHPTRTFNPALQAPQYTLEECSVSSNAHGVIMKTVEYQLWYRLDVLFDESAFCCWNTFLLCRKYKRKKTKQKIIFVGKTLVPFQANVCKLIDRVHQSATAKRASINFCSLIFAFLRFPFRRQKLIFNFDSFRRSFLMNFLKGKDDFSSRSCWFCCLASLWTFAIWKKKKKTEKKKRSNNIPLAVQSSCEICGFQYSFDRALGREETTRPEGEPNVSVSKTNSWQLNKSNKSAFVSLHGVC